MSGELTIAYSLETEKNMLWSICSDNRGFFAAEQILTAEDFGFSSHQHIYRAMQRMMAVGTPIDPTTLTEELRSTGTLAAAGGVGLISDLQSALAQHGHAGAYARVIRENAKLRRLQIVAQTTVDHAGGQNGCFKVVKERLEAELLALSTDELEAAQSRTADVDSLLIRMERERNRTNEFLGLPSGLRRLDALTRGFQPGEITFCGASSGGGKSAFLVQSAVEILQLDKPVLLFSLEMSKADIHRRILAILANVPYPRVRDPKWANKSDMAALYVAAEQLKKLPLYIVDKNLSIEQLTATARLHVRQNGVEFIGCDYVQIVTSRERDERMKVSAVSRGLTRLAKEEGVPVLALSQLARPDRQREHVIPGQNALRESSQLENDGHVILIFHRDRDPENAGRFNAEGIARVAKNRNGEVGDLRVRFDRASLTFRDSDTQQVQMAGAA